jgi:cell division septation protein DedD
MVTFRLHRTAVIWIAIGCVFVAMLLLTAGYLAGAAHLLGTRTAPVRPAPPKRAAAAKPSASGEAFALRVAIAMTEEEANAEVKRMKAKQLSAAIVPVETSDAAIVYEIHVGRYPDRAAAAKAAQSLRSDQSIDAAVVPASTP